MQERLQGFRVFFLKEYQGYVCMWGPLHRNGQPEDTIKISQKALLRNNVTLKLDPHGKAAMNTCRYSASRQKQKQKTSHRKGERVSLSYYYVHMQYLIIWMPSKEYVYNSWVKNIRSSRNESRPIWREKKWGHFMNAAINTKCDMTAVK